MWTGGVRAIILDESRRILMIRQQHLERQVWTVPGGGIEPGENSMEAAIREVKEETGLDVSIGKLVWHVEQLVPGKEPRFVNLFLATVVGGTLSMGQDPERSDEGQVIREVRFMTRQELSGMDGLYPEYLKDELWDVLDQEMTGHNPFKIRR